MGTWERLYTVLTLGMRVIILSILFSIVNFAAFAEASSTTHLRKLFHTAVLDSKSIPSFVQFVDQIKNPTPIELAYQAAAEALKAQEEWNPVEKLFYLKKFKKLMSRAVEQDAEEVEIRFLRFGIEYNIPGVLGFSVDLYEDKVMIIDSVAQMDHFEIDPYFSIYILTLLADSGLCSEKEIELVKSRIEP